MPLFSRILVAKSIRHNCIRNASLDRKFYDMVIVGGGMVGCSLAASAGSSEYFDKKSILVIDSAMPKLWTSTPTQYDIRVSALNPATVEMLEKIDVWNDLQKLRPSHRVRHLRVWDSFSSSNIHFEPPNPDNAVSFIVENNALITAFWRKIEKLPNVTIKTDGGSVKECRLASGDAKRVSELELADGTSVSTELLVGADGVNSIVRKAMNVHSVSWNYDQKAIVATLQLSDTTGGNDTAWQRFAKNGPIALLPLDERTSSLVWTTTYDEADRLVKLHQEQFVDELNSELFSNKNESDIVNRLLATLPVYRNNYSQYPPTVVALKSQRASFPLGFNHASNYVRPGVALVGDAAHRIHPLAGQGVNLGFGDAVALAHELEEAIGRGEKISSLSVLQSYESKRQLHNLSVMMTVDGLNRLYGTSILPVVLLRSFGLDFVNRLPALKNFFMKRASM